MKKRFFIFWLMVLVLTSCETGYDVDYRLVNNSGHTVTFTSNPKYQEYFWNDHPTGITIESGKDSLYFVVRDKLGSANFSSAKDILFTCEIYGDTIWFTFDDGKRLVYTREEGNGPYDFDGKHYTYLTKRAHLLVIPYDRYGYLTYTITEEDYAQAKQETDIPNKK